MLSCSNCLRHCPLDRSYCSRSDSLRINVYQLHFGEEPLISGAKGSGTIFFSHCNMRCVFCQNYTISQEGSGRDISQQELYDICKELESMGAHNINFVTPTPHTDKILPVIRRLKDEGFKLPVVWNCGGYESVESIKSLKGLVDIYLPDFKYSDDGLSVKYSSAPGYFENAKKLIREMRSQVKDLVDEEKGLMSRGLVIRHLVLPGAVQNSIGVLKAIKEVLGTDVYISLMSQYYPMHKAMEYPELSRSLTGAEYEEVCRYFEEEGFHNGFLQELSSASDEYIPDFFA